MVQTAKFTGIWDKVDNYTQVVYSNKYKLIDWREMALISIDIICDRCGEQETVTDRESIKQWNAAILKDGLKAMYLCGQCFLDGKPYHRV